MTEWEITFGAGLFIVGFLLVYVIYSAVERHQSVSGKKAEFSADNQSDQSSHKSDFRERQLPWFEILEVAEGAPFEVIQQAYRKRISQYHPDKIAGMADELRQLADVRTKEINDAFDFAKKHSPRRR